MRFKMNGLLFFLATTSLAQPLSLETPLGQKWVTAVASKQNTDENHTRNIQLRLRNLTKKPLQIIVPVGFIFAATDTAFQDFIHLEDKTIEIAAAKPKTVTLTGRCIRAKRKTPLEGALFMPTQTATGDLLALVQWAAQHKLAHTDAMQSALWCVTDQHELTGIDHLGMATFVSQQLQKPLPDYFTRYKMSERGGITAAEALEPLEIRGQFAYTLMTEQSVVLDLVNEAGISALKGRLGAPSMTQPAGKHRFTFHLKLRGTPRGTYWVTMRTQTDQQLCGQLKVAF